MKQISFTVTKSEQRTITEIARRAVSMARKHKIDYDMMTCDMDITACHANGNPLDLEELLVIDDFNFAHDVFGIRRHINRETGQLEDCFVPRMSAKYTTA